MTDNLAIWEAVKSPNPKYTKSFTRSGGFSGTAINAVYLIEKATELWGPMGGKWGVRIINEALLTGAPIRVEGEIVCHEIIHQVQIELFHPTGVVPSFGVTTFVGRNRNGPFTDEEAPKKSLTDALTKALSWLGFAADVHVGLFDDNKYVNDLRHKFEEEDQKKAEAETQSVFEKVIEGFRTATTLAERDKWKADASMLKGSARDQALVAYKEATERLTEPKEPSRETTYVEKIDAATALSHITALIKYAKADPHLTEDEKNRILQRAADRQAAIRQPQAA